MSGILSHKNPNKSLDNNNNESMKIMMHFISFSLQLKAESETAAAPGSHVYVLTTKR